VSRRLPIFAPIDERTEAIASQQPEWPCRRGCDRCCRSLGELPHHRLAEWQELWRGLEALEPAVRHQVIARIESLDATRPIVCPFLDRHQGACLVYEHRPSACRMYGFYSSRTGGRWCADIEAGVANGLADGIVLGNHDAMEAELNRQLGPTLTLREWLARH
jgi:Fe-S-cluster containining protein